MSQFSVYRNRSARSKATFPYLVDVQSELLESLQTRVVIPLTRDAALLERPVARLMPLLSFEGRRYLLMTPELAGIARSELGPVAGSVLGERATILAALDFLITGF